MGFILKKKNNGRYGRIYFKLPYNGIHP